MVTRWLDRHVPWGQVFVMMSLDCYHRVHEDGHVVHQARRQLTISSFKCCPCENSHLNSQTRQHILELPRRKF